MTDIYTHTRQLTVINEEPIGSIIQKQDDITRLFPTFYDRAKQVGIAGGVHLDDEEPGIWYFKANSVSRPGHKYDVVVQFSNIRELIKYFGKDKGNWTKEGDRIDLRKLAADVWENADLKIMCGCPAATYWGFNYIQTKRKTKFGYQERRPPRIRNPREHGIMCKHMQVVIDVLPFYKGDLAGHIKRFFMADVQAVEKAMAPKKPEPYKAGFKPLGTKAAPEAPKTPEKGAKEPEKGTEQGKPGKTQPAKPQAGKTATPEAPGKGEKPPRESVDTLPEFTDPERLRANAVGSELMALSDQGKKPYQQDVLKKRFSRLVEEFFDRTKTGIPMYDNMLANPDYFRKHKGLAFYIKELAPDEYFDAIETMDRGWHREMVEPKLVSRYAKQMRQGVKFHMPSIEIHYHDRVGSGSAEPYISIEQEGRHRVAAAKEAGAKKVPVMIIVPASMQEYDYVEKWMPEFLRRD